MKRLPDVGVVKWHMAKKSLPPSQVEQIAHRLRMGREALGMSAAELCRRTGIQPNTYSQWENSKGRPQLDEAIKLCSALGYTLDWIYLGDRSGLPYAIASKIAA